MAPVNATVVRSLDAVIPSVIARPPQGIRSVGIAGAILKALATSAGSMSLTELARKTGMPTSKARRYLVSLMRTDLVEQDPGTLRYGLGPLALQLGLAYLDRMNVVHLANQAALALRDDIRETVCVSIWGPYGASMISHHESPRLVRVNVRIGWALPALSSATGQVFGAFLPRDATKAVVEKEIEKLAEAHGTSVETERREADALLGEVRDARLARAPGNFVPGIHAVAAPVFDAAGRCVVAFTVIGPEARFAGPKGSEIATRLRDACARLSGALGYHD